MATPNGPEVRAQVAEQAPPRHAAEAADLADDGTGVGRDARELLGHAPMMAWAPHEAPGTPAGRLRGAARQVDVERQVKRDVPRDRHEQ